jgi:hypothetical protein
MYLSNLFKIVWEYACGTLELHQINSGKSYATEVFLNICYNFLMSYHKFRTLNNNIYFSENMHAYE